MTIEIPLTKGRIALVDDADYERLISIWRWTCNKKGMRFTTPTSTASMLNCFNAALNSTVLVS